MATAKAQARNERCARRSKGECPWKVGDMAWLHCPQVRPDKPAVTLQETGDSARGVPTTAAGTPSPAALPIPPQTRSRDTPDAGPSGIRDRDVDGPPIATGGLHPVAHKTPSRSRSAGGPPPVRDGPATRTRSKSLTFR
ncbi:unnamed protein product [Lampetra planeri]